MEKAEKLTDVLLTEKMISQTQLEESVKEQELTGLPIAEILVSKGFVTSENLCKAMASLMDITYVKLTDEKIPPQVIKMLPERMARQYKAIPVKIDGIELYVAFVSPLNLPARDEIAITTGYKIQPMVAEGKDMEQALNRYYKVEDTSKQTLIDMRMRKMKEKKEEEDTGIEEEFGKIEDLPVVKLLNDIMTGAVNAKASDIHFEPSDPEMIVRYRVDGILHDVMGIPLHLEPALISRIKILANLDITESRVSQDGHISYKKGEKAYDFRVSTILTVAGEKVVLRILDSDSMLIGLEEAGFSEHDKDVFKTIVEKPHGMILVTGPTGSGKTTTLYAVLNQMDSQTNNIVTIENPVEFKLNRINQIQVDAGAKITFASGLRTILRQDPDKIMVGEIRDQETAETATQAALTGHLVLSTLHTNDAAGAVTRLVDMGIEPFLISSTVIGALAQRLCRTICLDCREEYTPSKEELKSIGIDSTYEGDLARGKGCDMCFGTGYKGRTALFEVLIMSDRIRELIIKKESTARIKELAIQEGMQTLQQNGTQKVIDKVTTIEEIKRVVYV